MQNKYFFTNIINFIFITNVTFLTFLRQIDVFR